MQNKNFITVEITMNVTIQKAWEYFTLPTHITKWYFASDDWCAPNATNDLQLGGKFSTRMESKDGTIGFDFSGIYSAIELHEEISYILDDGRLVKNIFESKENTVKLTQTFEAENENTIELQKNGWQAILNNFKSFTECNENLKEILDIHKSIPKTTNYIH